MDVRSDMAGEDDTDRDRISFNASACFTSDRSFQIDSSIALNNAFGRAGNSGQMALNRKPRNTSPFPEFFDSIRLRDLEGTADAWAARLLAFGRALRAPECRRRPFREAQQHHSLACV